MWSANGQSLSSLTYRDLLQAGESDPFSPGSVSRRWHRRVRGVARDYTEPITGKAIWDSWVTIAVNRYVEKYDTVFIVDGKPRKGKSAFAIAYESAVAQRLQDEYGVKFDSPPDRETYTHLDDLIKRIRDVPRGSPAFLIMDEAALGGAQARAGQSVEGQQFDAVLSIVGIKRLMLGIISPNIWGIAAFARQRRAELFFHVETRGLATGHVLKDEMDYVPPHALPFRKLKKPWCKIPFPNLEKTPEWKAYEDRKWDATQEGLNTAFQVARKERLKREKVPLAMAIELSQEERKAKARQASRIGMRISRGMPREQAIALG